MKKKMLFVVLALASFIGLLVLLDVKEYEMKAKKVKDCEKIQESVYNQSGRFEFQQTDNENTLVLKQIHYHSVPDKEEKVSPKKEKKYFFIGDGRTVHLSVAGKQTEDTEFFCRKEADYQYMVQVFKEVLERCDEERENIIVSWFGMKDPEEVEEYSRFYNNVMLPEHVKLTVLSLTDGYDDRLLSFKINSFNKVMEENARNYKFIDLTDEIGKGKEIDVTDKQKRYYSKNSDEVFRVILGKLEEIGY